MFWCPHCLTAVIFLSSPVCTTSDTINNINILNQHFFIPINCRPGLLLVNLSIAAKRTTTQLFPPLQRGGAFMLNVKFPRHPWHSRTVAGVINKTNAGLLLYKKMKWRIIVNRQDHSFARLSFVTFTVWHNHNSRH